MVGYYEQLRIDRVKGSAALQGKLPEIVRMAVRDAVAENVTKALVNAIESAVPGGEATGLITKPVKDRITDYFMKELLKNMLASCPMFIKSAIMAIPVTDRESYTKILGVQLEKEFTQWLSIATLNKLLEDGIKDIVGQPELVVAFDS